MALQQSFAAFTLTGHNGPVLTTEVAPMGKFFVSGGTEHMLLWQFSSDASVGPKNVSKFSDNIATTQSCWAFDDTSIVLSQANGGSQWDLATIKEEKLFEAQSVQNTVSHSGGLSVFGGDDRVVRLCRGGRVVSSIRTKHPITAIALENETLAVGGVDGGVQLFDLRSSQLPIAVTETHADIVSSIVIAGPHLVTRGFDGGVCAWSRKVSDDEDELELLAAAECTSGHSRYLSRLTQVTDTAFLAGTATGVASIVREKESADDSDGMKLVVTSMLELNKEITAVGASGSDRRLVFGAVDGTLMCLPVSMDDE